MKPNEIEIILRDELRKIAPDIDVATIDQDADLREEFDIDSMDFLNLVTALSKRFQIEMPEADYQQLMTYNAVIVYLHNRA